MIPISLLDITAGRLAQIGAVMQKWPSFKEISGDSMLDLIAIGFGYASYASIQPADVDGYPLDHLPETVEEFHDLVAWRIYVKSKASISDARMAFAAAWQRCDLSVRQHFGWLGYRTDLRSGRGYQPEPDPPSFVQKATEQLPRHYKALRADGQLYWRLLAEHASQIPALYWSQESGIRQSELILSIRKSSWIALEDAVEVYSSAMPIGLEARTFYDMAGRMVGHGFVCPDINGAVSYIYPANGDLFKKACIELWYRRAAPPALRDDLPSTVFADDFVSPFLPPRIEEEVPIEVELEGRDLPGPERTAMRVINGRLDLGHSVEFEGTPYTRPAHAYLENDFDGLLDLKLVPASEVPADYCEWLRQTAPMAIEEGTCDLLFRVSVTLESLAELELEWLNQAGSNDKVAELARVTARYATPIQSAGSDAQMAGTLGIVEACDVPSAGQLLPHYYPELESLDEKCRGEYALNYWGKNGIRNHAFGERDHLFLAFAVLRNLGCDPFHYLGEHRAPWLAVFRLIRLALDEARPGELEAQIAAISRQARMLEQNCGAIQQLYDLLDASLSPSRIFNRVRAEGFVDCTNAIY